MKSLLADAANERLANASAVEPPMTEAEVLRVLASIARRGKPSDRPARSRADREAHGHVS